MASIREITKTVGDRIRLLREAKGKQFSRQWLADCVGVDEKTIRRIEGGDDIKFTLLLKICEALSVDPRTLLTEEDVPPPVKTVEPVTFSKLMIGLKELREIFENVMRRAAETDDELALLLAFRHADRLAQLAVLCILTGDSEQAAIFESALLASRDQLSPGIPDAKLLAQTLLKLGSKSKL